MTLRYGTEFARVQFPWHLMQGGLTLLYLAYPLIERQRQTNSFLTAHAACVSTPQGGILILGKEGAGKSSVAISLCRNHDAKLVANDLTVIGLRDGRIISDGGTKFLFLRQESVKRNMPDLLPFFPETSKDTWLHKIRIAPNQVGITCETGSVPIKWIYQVHIDGDQQHVFHCPDVGLVTRLYLNENFSRYIRSTCNAVLSGDNYNFLGYIPSLDTPEFYSFRVRLIERILDELTYLSGPLSQVTDFIVSHLES